MMTITTSNRPTAEAESAEAAMSGPDVIAAGFIDSKNTTKNAHIYLTVTTIAMISLSIPSMHGAVTMRPRD